MQRAHREFILLIIVCAKLLPLGSCWPAGEFTGAVVDLQ